MHLSSDPAIWLLGIYPDILPTIWKYKYTSLLLIHLMLNVIIFKYYKYYTKYKYHKVVLFVITKTLETTSMSKHRKLIEKIMVLTHNGVLCGYKQEWGRALWTDMEWFLGDIVKWKKQSEKAHI